MPSHCADSSSTTETHQSARLRPKKETRHLLSHPVRPRCGVWAKDLFIHSGFDFDVQAAKPAVLTIALSSSTLPNKNRHDFAKATPAFSDTQKGSISLLRPWQLFQLNPLPRNTGHSMKSQSRPFCPRNRSKKLSRH